MKRKEKTKVSNVCEVPHEMKAAMISMMKYIVSNEWCCSISNEDVYPSLSNGTGLSVDEIAEIVGNEKLYDSRYIMGVRGNPFNEESIMITIKFDKSIDERNIR